MGQSRTIHDEGTGGRLPSPRACTAVSTAFAMASFSKWIAAMGVMSLGEQGLLDLDAPISRYLTRWRLPEGPYNNDEVTVRRLRQSIC